VARHIQHSKGRVEMSGQQAAVAGIRRRFSGEVAPALLALAATAATVLALHGLIGAFGLLP